MAQYDERLQIDTPENVVFGYEVAGLGSRFLAAVVDTFILGMAILFLGILASAVFDFNEAVGAWVVAVLAIVVWVVFATYYIFFEMLWNGQSPGKRLMKMRVIRNNGSPVGFTESLVRNLLRAVDLFPGNYGVGAMAMFIDRQSRRLGDIAAGVLVVLEGEEVTLEKLESLDTRRRADSLLARLDVDEQSPVPDLPFERLDESDIQLVETYLERRAEIDDGGRWGRELIRRLSAKMDLPYQTRGDKEATLWLQRLVDTYRRRDTA